MSSPQPNNSATRTTASVVHITRALLFISLFSIMMMSLGAFFVSYHFLHEQTRSHLRTLIALTASEAGPALQFRDTKTATEILQSIPRAEGITLAELRSPDGILAQVHDAKNNLTARLAHWIGDERVTQDVIVEEKSIGSVVLEGGGDPMLLTLAGLLGWGLVVLSVVAASSLLLARRYTSRITDSILQLRSVVQRLIAHRDFTQRAPALELAEAEELGREFNSLLDEIVIRDQLLTQTNAALQRVAYIDSLTGLPNRAMFEEVLQRTLEQNARDNCSAALLYLDIDAFKAVNDNFGHGAGDQLLGEIGQRLRRWQTDSAVTARIGGDEFVVLVSPLKAELGIDAIAASLHDVLSAPLELNGKVLHPGVSIGSAIYPTMSCSPDELMRLADQAMYEAKDLRYRQNQITRWDADIERK